MSSAISAASPRELGTTVPVRNGSANEGREHPAVVAHGTHGTPKVYRVAAARARRVLLESPPRKGRMPDSRESLIAVLPARLLG